MSLTASSIIPPTPNAKPDTVIITIPGIYLITYSVILYTGASSDFPIPVPDVTFVLRINEVVVIPQLESNNANPNPTAPSNTSGSVIVNLAHASVGQPANIQIQPVITPVILTAAPDSTNSPNVTLKILKIA